MKTTKRAAKFSQRIAIKRDKDDENLKLLKGLVRRLEPVMRISDFGNLPVMVKAIKDIQVFYAEEDLGDFYENKNT